METVSWDVARNEVHDTSGITLSPDNYVWFLYNGVYYPELLVVVLN